MSGLNSLTTIIKRLEAATSRIEDLPAEFEHRFRQINQIQSESSPSSYGTHPAPPSAPSAPPAPPAPPISTTPAAGVPEAVVAFDDVIIKGKLKPFLELTRSFAGASLIEQVALMEREFIDLRALILMAALCLKPDQQALGDLLTPLQADIEAITRLKEANRKDREWFTHLSTVAEGAPCVGWVTVPTPAPYVNDIKDSTLFYGHRVIKEYKEKDPRHVEWVKSYVSLLEQMRSYIMEYHTTGLVWNANGIPVAQYNASISSAGAPPPPPPPPLPSASSSGGQAAAGGIANVFADLNRGEAITQGLRKVEKSEMTHKNPSLRAGSVVPGTSGSVAAPKKPLRPTKPQSLSGKRPSKFALEGNKWVIEYQENESSLVVENCELHQTVNLFGCKNSTIQIKGKVNAVTLVNCTKTSILVESVISTVSVTNSPSFALQITGSAPTIQVDSTDSGQIYLSKDCLGVELTTAKCSSINVSLPLKGEEEGVFEEQAVPEMLKTTVENGKLLTTVVEHVG